MRSKYYHYTQQDMADLLNWPRYKVARQIRKGNLDPTSLRAILAYLVSHRLDATIALAERGSH